VNKRVLILNITSMNELPLMERWLLRDHIAENLGRIAPYLSRYLSYRVVPAPPEAIPYGYYNWRVTELWMHESLPLSGTLKATFPPGYDRIVGQEGKPPYTTEWDGRLEGPHPPAICIIPVRPTEDFLGSELRLNDKTILRWLIAFKYPQGVSVDEGEDWFLNVHSKEVIQQPGLTRYYSHRTVESLFPWHRLSEQWYENFDGWRKSVIDSPPAYTEPPWAKHQRYPFLEPYSDFVSTFILERPTNDFLTDYHGYITAV